MVLAQEQLAQGDAATAIGVGMLLNVIGRLGEEPIWPPALIAHVSRTLAREDDIKSRRIADIMTRNPRTIRPEKLAAEAVQIMEENRINQLLVVSGSGELVGALNMHDLFQAKVI